MLQPVSVVVVLVVALSFAVPAWAQSPAPTAIKTVALGAPASPWDSTVAPAPRRPANRPGADAAAERERAAVAADPASEGRFDLTLLLAALLAIVLSLGRRFGGDR